MQKVLVGAVNLNLTQFAVEVVEFGKQISLEDAQQIKKSYKIGDRITTEFTPNKDFGRIAAQNFVRGRLPRIMSKVWKKFKQWSV